MIKAILFDAQGVLYVNGRLDSNLKQFIENESSRFRFALCTSSGDWVKERLKKDGLLDKFELVITADDAPFSKTDPKLYEYIAKKLKVETSEILFLDDMEQYVIAARKAGLRAIHYTDPESFQMGHEH